MEKRSSGIQGGKKAHERQGAMVGIINERKNRYRIQYIHFFESSKTTQEVVVKGLKEHGHTRDKARKRSVDGGPPGGIKLQNKKNTSPNDHQP